MRARQTELDKKGINNEYLTEMDTKLSNVVAQNVEQEKYKAGLKDATARLEELLDILHRDVSETTSIIKHNIPQEQWVEFGITAKR